MKAEIELLKKTVGVSLANQYDFLAKDIEPIIRDFARCGCLEALVLFGKLREQGFIKLNQGEPLTVARYSL